MHSSTSSSERAETARPGRRRYLCACVLLIGLFFAGDRLLGVLLKRQLLSSEHRFSRLYRGGMNNSVVFLGNSRGINSFLAPKIAEISGRKCFNLSFNSLSVNAAEVLLLDYLKHNDPPDLVVIEPTCVLVPGTSVNIIRPLSFVSRRVDDYCGGKSPVSQAAINVSHLFGYNNETFLRILHYRNRSDQDHANRYTISAAAVEKIRAERDCVSFKPDTEQLQALRRICEELLRRNIQPKLMIGPYLPDYRMQVANFDELLSTLRSTVPAGVEIIDMSNTVSELSFFADRVHLNHDGAEVFAKMLVQRGVVPAKQ